MGVALTSQHVTRVKGVWLCLSPSFCFSHRFPTSPVELFLSYPPLLLRANSPYHVSSFDIIEANFCAQTPTGLYSVSTWLCLPCCLLTLTATPLCPRSLDFSSIDPCACMGFTSTHIFSWTEHHRPTNHVCSIQQFYLLKKKNPDLDFFLLLIIYI